MEVLLRGKLRCKRGTYLLNVHTYIRMYILRTYVCTCVSKNTVQYGYIRTYVGVG